MDVIIVSVFNIWLYPRADGRTFWRRYNKHTYELSMATSKTIISPLARYQTSAVMNILVTQQQSKPDTNSVQRNLPKCCINVCNISLSMFAW